MRASGSQMAAASKATVVLGFSLAGPAGFAIT
jgi:hypothetical protein